MSEDERPAPAAGIGAEEQPRALHLRRAPKYGSFGGTGALLGLLLGVLLARLHPVDPGYSWRSVLGYFGLSFALLGVIAGLGVAVLVERRH